jgi:D-xylose transport system ATP-binding protein
VSSSETQARTAAGTPGGSELVRLSEVTKTFPGVKALDRVNLSVRSGEVLALVGENGAGKSTLMKILSGVYPAGTYEGEILVDGQAKSFRTPLEAEKAGIAIIHQELSSFPNLTVAENLYVGHWPTVQGTGAMINWSALRAEAAKWLARVGAKCGVDAPMSSLSVGTQQMVEIAKALSRDSKILILDEPTSALTPREVETLFALIRQLRDEGKGLVYISHKMEEIYAISDRITVLRDGKSVHEAKTSELPEDKLISHMVGRPLDQAFPVRPEHLGATSEVVLSVRDFSGFDELGTRLFGPVSFELKRGEILGFAGLLGAGRSELMKALFGDSSVRTEGEVTLNGKAVHMHSPRDGLRHGISFVGEDRKHDSILPKRSLEENVSVSRLASRSVLRALNLSSEFEGARKSLAQFRTRCTGPAQEIQNLSGGNQQKAVIARALQTSPDVIILDEPTRGIDVGAKFEIYEILFNLAKEGKALLVVSSDLPEVIGLSDRIIVLSQGEFMGCLNQNEFSQPAIMKLAIGKSSVRV